ncbi:DNA mismatch repair endonuclease MutL [Paenibacillus sp. IB182496]|uniref:DNA mismatch repair protein MutL n=1 Tax=Paenibacillus sabuli TaxID=2772509 RepID=A0A927BVI9_9BACL|nr:DNA mismatch repair endonuclease MutL [Paenibacillus sabuli]MBD2847616.1 DNA mismatch repair endonuclease MutL [Paenibacillus sabuli]
MPSIQVMSEQLANQIAAGEVVERPASVVKELVENAIDAGGTAIEITVAEGGLDLIRVVDNGAGIEAEEVATAFQRHATSKLLEDRELFRIASLGFRGEALPSIAAVARVECVSAPQSDGLAQRLVIEGGRVVSAGPIGAPQGTDMTVRDLFYNTPARLKYMKSIQTELGHISDYVYRLALAHPGIAFSLRHNGNQLLRTPGNGDRLQVIAAVYGTNTARGMLALEGEHPDYDLRGFISKPELTRASRTALTTIVNGRYIRSFALTQSILQAYHTLLPINRYPLAVLEIGMHPSLVDVNVHPSKLEVRFSKEPELRAFVQETVRACLARQTHIPGQQTQRRSARPEVVQERMPLYPQAEELARMPERRSEPDQAPPLRGRVQPGGRTLGSDRPASSYGRGSDGAVPWERPARIPRGATEALYSRAELRDADDRLRTDEAGQGASVPTFDRRRSDSDSSDSQYFGRDGADRVSAQGRQASAGTDELVDTQAADTRPADTQAADAQPVDAQPNEQGHAADVQPNAQGHAAVVQPNAQNEAAATDADVAGLASGGGEVTASDSETPARSGPDSPAERADAAARAGADRPNGSAEGFPELAWVGQLHGTYLIAQNETGMYLIDQHAAHERIHYELFYRRFGAPDQAAQQLLVPFTLEYTPADAAALREQLPLLAQAGVELEPFGQHAFLVRTHPQWLPRGAEQAVVEEMIEWVLRERRTVDIAKLREKSAILCACKASIKANAFLTRESGEALLHRLAACEQPYTCPHGRPIVVHVSTYQLEKMFKRVMA